MNRTALSAVASLCLCAGVAAPYAGEAQTAAKHTAAKVSIVDQTLKLLQAKVPESMIIKKIQDTNTPVNLSTDQMVALKTAGASDTVMTLLENPKATVAAGDAASVAAVNAAPQIGANPSTPPPTPVSTVTSTTHQGSMANNGKKRVAVDEFDYSTVKTAVASIFGTDQDIGKGIQSLFVTRIAKEGKVVVVERKKINKIMAEQDFAASGRVKAGTGAKTGAIRGADAILYGDIVTFGRDDHRKAVAGGGLIGAGIAGLAAAGKKDKAVVTIDYRLVDAETSEVIATGEAKGESERKSNSFGAFAGALGAGGAGVAVDMSSSNFAETIIGEAVIDCVNKLAAALDEQLPKLETKQVDVSARVAFVSGNSLTINAGSAQGVAVGDQFQISHILNEVKDPSTGEVIDLATKPVGTMQITQVKDKVSIGTFTGSPAAQIGDVAEKH
jgi:curli biogenesis system outer membrane secretion channel CsgG